ncbi:zinc finger BED domain-containing protein RICESLEEPER 2-like protein [Tanacetum coccineum]
MRTLSSKSQPNRSRLEVAQRGQIKTGRHPVALHGPEEEVALCKGWVHVSENSVVGNARKECQFWIRDYFTTTLLHYDVEFGVPFTLRHYWEVLRKSLKWIDSEVLKFDEKKKDVKRYNTSGSSSFNTESGDASINLSVDVGDNEEDEVHKLARPMGRDKAKVLKKKATRSSGSSSSMNEEALARLMLFELAMHNEHAMEMKKEECLAFLEIRRR